MVQELENDLSDWESSDVFSSKVEAAEYLLLKYLAQTREPAGSWVLKVVLEMKHIEVSTATIGRILKNLDTKEFTRLIESQGRVITAKGRAYVDEVSERVEREQLQKNLTSAAQPRTIDELVDLLRARKALECETAGLAALRAEDEDLEALEHSMKKHEAIVLKRADPTATALDFHEKVALASRNKFLIAALDVLIYEEIKLESKFSELITRERGKEYLLQHRTITEAIRNRDSGAARHLMGVHIETLIEAVQEQGRNSSKLT